MTGRRPLAAIVLAAGVAGAALGVASCGEPYGAASAAEGGATSDVGMPDGSGSDARSDGAVDAGTDGATPDGAVVAPPCMGNKACPRYVFVTAATFFGEQLGGPFGADGICQSTANQNSSAPVLAGRDWQAWISGDVAVANSAGARLVHGTQAYRLIDGTVIAADWTELTSGHVLHAIDQVETGVTLENNRVVWTGTTAAGANASTCTSWTQQAAGDLGTIGNTGALDAKWTAMGTQPCKTGSGRLYCVER